MIIKHHRQKPRTPVDRGGTCAIDRLLATGENWKQDRGRLFHIFVRPHNRDSQRAMSRTFPYALLAVKALLLAWGVLGMWEYIDPAADFGLQNQSFPPGTQLLHWILLMLTGSIFVFGYVTRWKHTPIATVAMYATLATLCFIETLDFGAFGGGTTSYVIMGVEYLVYIALGLYLLRSQRIAEHFTRQP